MRRLIFKQALNNAHSLGLPDSSCFLQHSGYARSALDASLWGLHIFCLPYEIQIEEVLLSEISRCFFMEPPEESAVEMAEQLLLSPGFSDSFVGVQTHL